VDDLPEGLVLVRWEGEPTATRFRTMELITILYRCQRFRVFSTSKPISVQETEPPTEGEGSGALQQ
jgi:hypothetical protein